MASGSTFGLKLILDNKNLTGILADNFKINRANPKAMLFANHIDSLAACGILMGDNWLGKRIVTVDMLGQEFLDTVKTGQTVCISEDGTVEIKD